MLAQRQPFAPVMFAHAAAGHRPGHQGPVAQRHDNTRPVARVELGQRRQVQMVVVIVRYQHHVNGRQGVKRHAWRRHPSRPDERQRRSALGPHRVNQEIQAVGLNQHGGMPNQRNARGAVVDADRRRGQGLHRHRVWPLALRDGQTQP